MLWLKAPVDRAIALNDKAIREGTLRPEDLELLGCPPDAPSDIVQRYVADFQAELGIPSDGWAGPMTELRLDIMRIAEGIGEFFADKVVPPTPEPMGEIVVGGKLVSIPWARVVHLRHPDAMPLKRFSKRKKCKPGMIIHWPVTYTVIKFVRVMLARKLGSHFSISAPYIDPETGDVYVIIWQHGDPIFRGVHAIGSNDFVGIDITSPVHARDKVLTKLQKMGCAPRPIIKDARVQGWRPKPFLGLHPVQEQALAALLAALHVSPLGLVLETPDDDGWMNMRRLKSKKDRTPGLYSHAQVDFRKSGKYDYAGCNTPKIIGMAQPLVEQLRMAV